MQGRVGRIKLYIGPMFSGKTSKLISKYTGPEECLAIKPTQDTRCLATEIKSHDGITIPAIAIPRLDSDKPEISLTIQRVLVDEGQFFPDLALGCMQLVSMGIDVYVAALNGTSEREPWPSVSALIPHADKIEHVTAVRCSICKKRRAPFTAVKKGCEKTGTVMIGGAESYFPVCRNCTSPEMGFKNGAPMKSDA